MNQYLSTLKYEKTIKDKLLLLHDKYNEHDDNNGDNKGDDNSDDNSDSKVNNNEVKDNSSWNLMSLEFSNFFSYGENQTINFDELDGVIGIFAPNHYGKSAIFDIILFTLFEKTSRGLPKYELINKDKISLKSSLVFQISSSTKTNENEIVNKILYKVSRYNTGKKFYKELINLNTNEKYEGKDVDKKMVELIGTYDDFLMTTMTIQNHNLGFINFKQQQRKEYFYQILHLSKYEKIEEEAKKDLKFLKGQLKTLDGNKKYHIDKKYEDDIEKKELEIKEISQRILEIHDDIDILNGLIGEEKQQLLPQTVAKPMKTTKNLTPDEYRKLKEKYSDNIIVSQNIKNEIEKLKEKIIKNKLLLENNNDCVINTSITDSSFNNVSDVCDVSCKEKIKKLTDAKNKRKELKSRNKVLEKRIDNLKSHKYNHECNYCCMNEKVVQSIEFSDELKVNIGELETINVEYGTTSEIKDKIKEIQISLDKIRHEYECKMIEEKKKKEELNNELLRKNKKYTKRIERLEAFVVYDEFVEYTRIDEHNTKVNKRIIKLIQDKNSLMRGQDGIDELEKQKVRCECLIEKYQENIILMTKCLNDFDNIDGEIDIIKKYIKMVGASGICLYMLRSVIPQLEKEINEFIKPFVSFKLLIQINKSNVDIFVSQDIGSIRKWNATGCSGFEQFIINLAFKIVIGRITNTNSPDFMAVDEGWGCFDGNNIEKIDKIFDIMRRHYNKVIIISHIEKLKEKVNHNIGIELVDGYSTLLG